MGKQKLNPKILLGLREIYPKRTKESIQSSLSQMSNKKGITLGAAAEILAKQAKRTFGRYLNEEDKKCLRNSEIKIIKYNPSKSKHNLIIFVKFKTNNNKFLDAHLEEINKAYTAHCYTAAFILIRKVIENLITDIIKKKFPDLNREHQELYLNFSTGHIKDLSDLIKNLRDKSNDFAPDEKKLTQRILQLSERFKNDANDKTHSLYHISSKKELDDANPQQILDLIEEFFEKF